MVCAVSVVSVVITKLAHFARDRALREAFGVAVTDHLLHEEEDEVSDR